MAKSILGWAIWLAVLLVMYGMARSYLHTKHIGYFVIIFLALCVSVLLGFRAIDKNVD
jgi:hypothetical protein